MKKNLLKRWIIISIIVSFAGIWPKIGAAQDAMKFFSKGTEHLRLGELDEALTALTQAINLKSDYAAAYNNRGLTYYEKDEIMQMLKSITPQPSQQARHRKSHIMPMFTTT
jgi:tetratricopeptide (TPR) repeat protein